MLVQVLVTDAAIEALDEAVLHGLARLDKVELDPWVYAQVCKARL